MKEYKVGLNSAIVYFEVFYLVFIIWQVILGNYQEALVTGVASLFIYGYLHLWRPYKYSIDRKILTIHRRLGKNKEVNLMTCETICDPIPKMTKIIVNPHSLEIYTTGKKRFVVSPKKRLAFVQGVMLANKRIHVQVKDYAKNHKTLDKQVKKARKKELKKESND